MPCANQVMNEHPYNFPLPRNTERIAKNCVSTVVGVATAVFFEIMVYNSFMAGRADCEENSNFLFLCQTCVLIKTAILAIVPPILGFAGFKGLQIVQSKLD